MTAPLAWLEDQYETVSAALDAVRRGKSLSPAEREVLREACVAENGLPPRPATVPGLDGRKWHWHPGESPGPDDGRAHP